jgi:hypothetical protein
MKYLKLQVGKHVGNGTREFHWELTKSNRDNPLPTAKARYLWRIFPCIVSVSVAGGQQSSLAIGTRTLFSSDEYDDGGRVATIWKNMVREFYYMGDFRSGNLFLFPGFSLISGVASENGIILVRGKTSQRVYTPLRDKKVLRGYINKLLKDERMLLRFYQHGGI